MIRWRSAVAVVSVLLLPMAVSAAPAGKVTIAQGVDPTTLDIMNQQETPASVVGAHIFEGLVERDQSLKLVPALAAEMPKLVAPTTWEFKLRRGVKFHNGDVMTADDVKFSFERYRGGAAKLLKDRVKDVQIVDRTRALRDLGFDDLVVYGILEDEWRERAR